MTIQHLGGDCYTVSGALYYAKMIDAFAIPSEAAAMDCMEVLAHYSSLADPSEKVRAERKLALIAKKWAPHGYQRKMDAIAAREQQWLTMLKKLVANVLLHKDVCHADVVAQAERYRNSMEQTQ